MYELGGYNVGMYDNYSRGGLRSITVDGSNSSGVAHDNQISNYIYAPYNDNGAHDLLINNGSAGPLTWDLNRPKPGPNRRVGGLALTSSALTITGTKLNDAVSVNEDANGMVTVTLNAEPFTAPASAFSSLVQFAGGKHLSSLNIGSSGGTLTVQDPTQSTANSAAGALIFDSPVSISGTAKLDLTNNSMIVHYGSGGVGTLVNDTRLNLQNGRLITSSAGTPAGTRLGYGDNAVLGKTTFAGQSVGPNCALLKFTYGGDANLDGQVDVTDLGILSVNWQAGVGNPLTPTQPGNTNADFMTAAQKLGLSKKQLAWLQSILGANAGSPRL